MENNIPPLNDFYNWQDCRGKFLIMDIFVKPNFRVKLMFLIMDISSYLWIWCSYLWTIILVKSGFLVTCPKSVECWFLSSYAFWGILSCRSVFANGFFLPILYGRTEWECLSVCLHSGGILYKPLHPHNYATISFFALVVMIFQKPNQHGHGCQVILPGYGFLDRVKKTVDVFDLLKILG